MTYKIMNDLVFKYAYGQDTQSSKSALKGLLETFLDVKIKEVQIKNTNTPNRNVKSKDSRFDIVAKLDNHTMIDVEMRWRVLMTVYQIDLKVIYQKCCRIRI